MHVLGLTGGVATGKSTFSKLLAALLEAEIFDSDQCVHDLLANSKKIHDLITGEFGFELLDISGKIDRKKLGKVVFQDRGKRRVLEAIIHPEVRLQWRERIQMQRDSEKWLLIDIPLLFETDADRELPTVVTIGCSRETQMSRLTLNRALTPERARQMIAAQMDISTKITRSNYLVWNDGDLSSLERQASLCARFLLSK